jgi:hypothetical protein
MTVNYERKTLLLQIDTSQSRKYFFGVNLLILSCKLGRFINVHYNYFCAKTLQLTKKYVHLLQSFIKRSALRVNVVNFSAMNLIDLFEAKSYDNIFGKCIK